ncbi:Ig-like domain-containing protein [Pantoea sp.]|uniref:Ig-like domain-containing protein n=1 Tax=Pantoea sp. TaxID=69393 RepID=UPI0031D26D71
MSTSKNQNASRPAQASTTAASIASAAVNTLPPIVPIKYDEAIIDTIRSPINNRLTPIESGGEVQQGTLIFEGRATANKQVIIYDNGIEIARVITNSSGRWVYDANTFKGEEHHFTVQVVGAGNPISASYDITIPAVSTQPVTIDFVYDNNNPYVPKTLKPGDTTQDTTPRFDGKAAANTVIRLFNGDKEIASTVSDAWGNWSLTPNLSAGSYNLVFKAGEGSASKPFALTITSAEAQPIEITNVIDDSDRYYYKPLKSGDITQDTTPRFNGKAGANSLIRLFNGDKEIGSTVSDAWGNWSLTPNLPAGSYNLVFKAGEGSQSKPFALTIASAQAQPVEVLNVYDDSDRYYYKPLKSGDSTQDTTPRFNGKAGSNTLIRLFNGDKEIGSTLSDAYGNWSLTPSLPAGSYNLVFKTSEGTASKPFALDITSADSQPIEIFAALEDSRGYNQPLQPGATIKDTTPYFYGKAGANVLIRLYNGDKVIGSTVSDAYGNWNLTPTLTSGSYNLVFKAGEGSQTKPFPVTIASAAAEPIEVFGAFDNSNGYNQQIHSGATTKDTTPRFIGKAGANTLIRLYDGEKEIGSTFSDAYGNWSLTPELPFGSFNLVFKTAEGTASAPFIITIAAPQPIAPQVPEIEYIIDDFGQQRGLIEKGATTDDDTPRFFGNAEPNSLVQIFDNGVKIGERRVSSTGYWDFTPVNPAYLENGKHSFVIKSSNGTETAALDFIVKVPVSVDLIGSNSGEYTGENATEDTTPFITGRGPKGALIRLYEGEKEIGSVIASKTNGSWKFDFTSPLEGGAHSIVAKSTTDNSSEQFDFVIIAPVAPVEPESPFQLNEVIDNFFMNTGAISANAATDDNQPKLAGKAPANSVVRIFDKGIEIGSALANAQGNWEFEPGSALALGQHVLTVGESASNVSASFTFNVVATQVFAPWVLGGISDFDGVDNFAYNATIYDNTPVFNGVAQVGSSVNITVDGQLIGSTITDQYGRWSFQTTEPLAAGGHEVVATDVNGNKGATLIVSLIDPEEIEIKFSVYNDEAGEAFIGRGEVTNDSTPLIRGLAGQNIVLEIYDNGQKVGSVLTAQDGTWSFQLELADGAHRIEVKGEYKDALLAREFTVAADVADAVSIDSITGRFFDYGNAQPSGGEPINDNSIVLYGKATPDATVQLLTTDGRSLGFTGANVYGKWYLEVDSRIEDGEYSVIARVNGADSEVFTFQIGEPAPATKNEEINLFDILGTELLGDAQETLLSKDVEVEAQPASLNLSQADLSVVTTSGIATNTAAVSALQEEQYQAI